MLMDDDIRNRFRGVSRGSSAPERYVPRPARPTPRPVAHKPPPVDKPKWPAPVAAQSGPDSRPLPHAAAPAQASTVKNKGRKSRTGFKKKVVLLLLILVLAAAGSAAFYFEKYSKAHQKSSPKTPAVASSVSKTTTAKPTGTIRLIATGDNLSFDSINTAAKKADGTYDYLPMMSGLKPFFDKADIRLCNETTPGGGDKNGLAISGYPNFNAATEWSSSFAGLGCNVINLASDHINDKGQPAIDATLGTWDKQKSILAVAGANRSAEEQTKIRYFTVKGLKFAYLTYTTSLVNKTVSSFGVNQYSDDLANKQITEARKSAALVIVSMNWGTENSADVTAEQDRIASSLANQNVDVIIGGGPHVLQPAKILSGKDGHQTLAWFSLGNFLNSALPVDNLIGGMAVMDFDAGTQQLKDPKLMPLYMHYEWTAAQKAAGTVNARHNFMLYPLDQAADALTKSQNGTTIDAQTARVTSIITKFAPVKVIKSTEF